LLTLKKKMDFKPDYEPKILTEKYLWFPPAKLNAFRKPEIDNLRSKYGKAFMTTRQERIRQVAPESRIKAFTQADVKECAEGDCDRFFRSDITQRWTKEMTNKQ
jgi:hypothetical protein